MYLDSFQYEVSFRSWSCGSEPNVLAYRSPWGLLPFCRQRRLSPALFLEFAASFRCHLLKKDRRRLHEKSHVLFLLRYRPTVQSLFSSRTLFSQLCFFFSHVTRRQFARLFFPLTFPLALFLGSENSRFLQHFLVQVVSRKTLIVLFEFYFRRWSFVMLLVMTEKFTEKLDCTLSIAGSACRSAHTSSNRCTWTA